jgi:acetyl-CoA synthetase
MLPEGKTYDEVNSRFRWEVPEFYNIGVDVCDKWAAREPGRVAIIEAREDGADRILTFGELFALSNQTANLLAVKGIGQGDRIGILLPQMAETAYSHIAAYKLGAIAIPLFTLFGEEALAYRLGNAGAKAVITNAEGARKLAVIRDSLPGLEHIFCVDGAAARFPRPVRGPARDFQAGEQPRRRSGADHLHIRHDRPAQGRAPCPPRATRPSARRGDEP